MTAPQVLGSRIVVYTALFGDYEGLVEQPLAGSSEAAFVCFTDNPSLESKSWDIRVVDPTIPWDSTRMARKAKVTGYRSFAEADVTIWIDNRVILKELPESIVNSCLGDHEMSLPLHSHRDSVADEFIAVLDAGFEDPWRVREQMSYLSREAPEVLREIPYWTAILIRRATPSVDRAMEIWIDLIFRHSRRDQLSINYALRVAGVDVHPLSISNVESHMHEWLRVNSLPKSTDELFSRRWRYSLSQHTADSIRANRVSIALRTRLKRLRKSAPA